MDWRKHSSLTDINVRDKYERSFMTTKISLHSSHTKTTWPTISLKNRRTFNEKLWTNEQHIYNASLHSELKYCMFDHFKREIVDTFTPQSFVIFLVSNNKQKCRGKIFTSAMKENKKKYFKYQKTIKIIFFYKFGCHRKTAK